MEHVFIGSAIASSTRLTTNSAGLADLLERVLWRSIRLELDA